MKADASLRKRKTAASKPAAQRAEASVGDRVKKEIIAWFWIGLVFLLVNGTLGQARVIPSGSMENTLLVGDHLIMSRVGYDAGIPFTNIHIPLWRDPKRQQIIIFKPPYGKQDQPDLIKRVIGLPGDKIEIHNGSAWINGAKLQENYTMGPTELPSHYELLPSFQGVPLTVPENHYFVMGDNRGNSYDSRYWAAFRGAPFLARPWPSTCLSMLPVTHGMEILLSAFAHTGMLCFIPARFAGSAYSKLSNAGR